MAIKGDYAQILAGLPISIFGANVAVTQPMVKDICAFGEDKFLSQVSIFLNLDSFTEKIKEGNSQLEMLSDFQIFMTVLNEDETFSQEILNFFELIFPNYHVVLDSGCIQFQLAEDGPFIGQINPMNFETFCDTLKELFIPFNADEVEYNPANDKAKEIAEMYPTPFYLYDEEGIRETVRNLYKAFSWNEGYREYFAIKATPNPTLLRILKEEGCGVDCSSDTELSLAEACGFSGSEIMFSSNDTPDEEYVFANRLGGIINLDDFTNIDEVTEILTTLPKTMSLRFNPGGYFSIGNTIMDNPEEAKYGMTEAQILEGYRILKERGVEHFGIHAFLASNTISNDYYPELARQLFSLVVKIKEECGISLEFVNLSGGVGIPYRPEQEATDIFLIGEKVREVYEEILVKNGLGHIRLCSELGRYVLGPHGALITKVLHFKNTYRHYAGVDACASNLMRPAIYDAYHHITVLGKEDAKETEVYDVVGSLCENNDKFAKGRELPKLEKGDLLFIHDTGAHGFAMGYNYNGKLWSSELLLQKDGTVKMIRRAEKDTDYFATLDIDEGLSNYLQSRK